MHYIYILTDRTYSKIGITKNLKKRISTYSCHNPSFSLFKNYECDSITAQTVENKIKSMFELDRVKNSKEWFTIDAELIDEEVKKLIQVTNNSQLIIQDGNSFTDKELRDISNFEAIYEQYIQNEREYNTLPYAMYSKTVKGHNYLYEKRTSHSTSTSIGLLKNENIERLEKYKSKKENLDNRKKGISASMDEHIKYFRLSQANRVDSKMAKLLRNLDEKNMLGTQVIITGDTAFAAYEIHSQSLMFSEQITGKNFKLSLYKNDNNQKPLKLIQLLQNIDKTYVLNHKKPFQAVNAHGYEVELLAAPSVINKQANLGGFRPIPLMEQEWLLKGTPLRHILLSNDLKPAPIVAHDPRWMALHKIWLSQKPIRDKTKVQKDFKQGTRLLSLVVEKMQYEYPLDNSFTSQLPKELKAILDIHAKISTKKLKLF